MTIYIVCASSGMYSDRSEWLVAVYADEASANEHAAKAREYDEDAQRKLRGYLDDDEADEDSETSSPSKYPKNPWDRQSPCYDAVYYSVVAMELLHGAAVPETLCDAVRNCKAVK